MSTSEMIIRLAFHAVGAAVFYYLGFRRGWREGFAECRTVTDTFFREKITAMSLALSKARVEAQNTAAASASAPAETEQRH